MGSIKTLSSGVQTHWMDSLRIYKPQKSNGPPKQKESQEGQLPLFSAETIKHLKPKRKTVK
jgi:hypothetical protein